MLSKNGLKKNRFKKKLPIITFVASEISDECNEFIHLAKKIDRNKTYDDWEQVGEGAAGNVYINTKKDYDYVVKIQKADDIFLSEVLALTDLQKYLNEGGVGVVPKLYANWTYKGDGYIVIEKLKDSYGMRADEMDNALKKIAEYGWLHLDISTCNRMNDKYGNLVLIDFGWAVKKPDNLEQIYPLHPLSVAACKAFTYNELKSIQDFDFKTIYGHYLGVKQDLDDDFFVPSKTENTSWCVIM
jgi:serine/threonine protein kinase